MFDLVLGEQFPLALARVLGFLSGVVSGELGAGGFASVLVSLQLRADGLAGTEGSPVIDEHVAVEQGIDTMYVGGFADVLFVELVLLPGNWHQRAPSGRERGGQSVRGQHALMKLGA